jgi:drug/metabolite transporter (DMT)-like permease
MALKDEDTAMSAYTGTLNGTQRMDTTATVAVALTVLGWASAFPAIRAGLGAFQPLELGALRFAIAAVPAAIFLAVKRPALPRVDELWRFAFGGAIFVALYTVMINYGELTVSAGAASFIINVSPIFTAIMATALLGERFSRLAWLGTLISFTGCSSWVRRSARPSTPSCKSRSLPATIR